MMAKKDEFYDDESGKKIDVVTGTYRVEFSMKVYEQLQGEGYKVVDNKQFVRYFENKASFDKWIKKLESKIG